MRGGAQAYGVHFVDALVLDVLFQKIGSEYTTFEQKFMIGFESIQDFSEGAGYLLDLLLFLGGQFIQITSRASPGSMSVADAVQACHQDRGKGTGTDCRLDPVHGIPRAWLSCSGGRDSTDRRAIAL